MLHNGSLRADTAVAKATLLNEHFASCFTSVDISQELTSTGETASPTLYVVQCEEDEVLRLLSSQG